MQTRYATAEQNAQARKLYGITQLTDHEPTPHSNPLTSITPQSVDVNLKYIISEKPDIRVVRKWIKENIPGDDSDSDSE